MSRHTPKYSILAQCLINACQAAELIPGASVVITEQSWKEMAGKMVDSDRAIFNAVSIGDHCAITLSHENPNR